MAVITVLGAGVMATALCVPLADNGHEVRLVGTPLDREIIDSIKANHVHPVLALTIPESITAYHFEEARTPSLAQMWR